MSVHAPIHEKVQVWITQGSRILLLKTTACRGAFWQPVTGGVEPAETHAQAAVREAHEETGLDPKRFQSCIALECEVEFDGRWGRAHEVCFWIPLYPEHAEKPLQVCLDETEHQDWSWVAPSEVEKMLTYDSNLKGYGALKLFLSRV